MSDFIWNGKTLKTVGDINDAMLSITNKQEAIAFRDAYRKTNEFADENLGYLTGYCGATEMGRLQDLFEVGHPIFGRSTPTPEEAFTAGKTIGRIIKGAA